jgi:hypothetical protein
MSPAPSSTGKIRERPVNGRLLLSLGCPLVCPPVSLPPVWLPLVPGLVPPPVGVVVVGGVSGAVGDVVGGVVVVGGVGVVGGGVGVVVGGGFGAGCGGTGTGPYWACPDVAGSWIWPDWLRCTPDTFAVGVDPDEYA